MKPEAIVQKARETVLKKAPFVLATVDETRAPCMRWMGDLVLEEPMTVFMSAMKTSRKIAQIKENPNAQLLFQDHGFKTVVTLFGTCELDDSVDRRKQLWNAMPELKNYVSGPDDPNLAVLRFQTRRIEVLGLQDHGVQPLVATL
jgi:general stress protein 26